MAPVVAIICCARMLLNIQDVMKVSVVVHEPPTSPIRFGVSNSMMSTFPGNNNGARPASFGRSNRQTSFFGRVTDTIYDRKGSSVSTDVSVPGNTLVSVHKQTVSRIESGFVENWEMKDAPLNSSSYHFSNDGDAGRLSRAGTPV